MNKKKLLLVPLMLLAVVGSLQAADVPVYMVSGNGWKIADRGNCKDLTITDGERLTWGVKEDKDFSTLSFVGSKFALPNAGQDVEVDLGTLSYFNAKSLMTTTETNSKWFTADWNLNVSADLSLGLWIQNSLRKLRDGTFKDDSVGDLVQVTIPADRILFSVDKKQYALSLLGFFGSKDGKESLNNLDAEGNLVAEFPCMEGKTTDGILRARVSSVPIPATAWLLGSGLLGLLGFRRRQTV